MSSSNEIAKKILENPEMKFVFDSQLANKSQFAPYFEDPEKIMKVSRKLKMLKDIEKRYFTLSSFQKKDFAFSKDKTLNEVLRDHIDREREIAGALSGHLIISEK